MLVQEGDDDHEMRYYGRRVRVSTIEDLIVQETADPTAQQEDADPIQPEKIPEDISVLDWRMTRSMTKDITEDIPKLVKDSGDEEEPSLKPQVNGEPPTAKKDEVSFIGPVEPP